jgi:hypothetical protein
LTTGCAAVAIAALAGTAAAADPPASLLAAASPAVLLAAALAAGRVTPAFVAVLLLGAIYLIPEGDRALPAPIYAGTLLLTAELALWSLDERERANVEPGTVMPRLRGILVVAAVGVPAAWLVQLASEADIVRSPAWTAAGAAAILACVAILTALARSHRLGVSGSR